MIDVTCGDKRASVPEDVLKNLPVLWSAHEACGACTVPPERWDDFVAYALPYARRPSAYILPPHKKRLETLAPPDVGMGPDQPLTKPDFYGEWTAADWQEIERVRRVLLHPAHEALRYFGVPHERLMRLDTAEQLYADRRAAAKRESYFRQLVRQLLPTGTILDDYGFGSFVRGERMSSWFETHGIPFRPVIVWHLVRSPVDVRAALQTIVEAHDASATRLEDANAKKRKLDAEVETETKRVAFLQPRAAEAKQLLGLLPP